MKRTEFTIDLRKPEQKNQFIYCFNWHGIDFTFITDSSETMLRLFRLFSSESDEDIPYDEKYFRDERIKKPQKLANLNFSQKLLSFYFGSEYAVKFKTFLNKNIVFMFSFNSVRKAAEFLSILDKCGVNTL